MLGIAFCHGWSFDTQSLAPLQAALAQRLPDVAQASFDLGFTGTPQTPALAPDVDWIALGHSWGFAWLLQQDQPWRAAIAINGFSRFCRRPGHPEGAPARLVDAMLARLQTEAQAVVQDFHARCGVPAPQALQHLDQAALQQHLQRLRDLDIALPACPLLALATDDDAIVPPALARACFVQDGCTLQHFPGDHLQLLRAPDAAADAIAAFIESLHA